MIRHAEARRAKLQQEWSEEREGKGGRGEAADRGCVGASAAAAARSGRLGGGWAEAGESITLAWTEARHAPLCQEGRK